MSFSALDLFTIGVGPSSSHTVGPMRAARRFGRKVEESGLTPRVARLRCDLYASLAATGKGHGTDGAIILGFLGEDPENIDVDGIPARPASYPQCSTMPCVSATRRFPMARTGFF